MDTIRARTPAAPLLLVRRADPAGERDVAALLQDVPVDPEELADLIRRHGVLVLSDLTLPAMTPPLAAAAFRLDRSARTAQLAGIGVGRSCAGGAWGSGS